jgi:GNAT superfamily N-acetyltransferase
MVSDLPDRGQRIKIASDFFELYVKFALENGVVHLADTTKEGVVGSTIWLSHDADDSCLADDIERVSGPHAARFSLFAELLSAHYPPVEEYEKLMAISTHPSIHGLGIGSALISHRLHDLDQAGIPTYLEATTRNAAGGVYERFGYQPIGEPIHFSGGLSAFPMWRDAHESRSFARVYGLDDSETRMMNFARQNWRVLDVIDGKALILRDKVIGKEMYHCRYENTTWAEGSLREYLNGTFFGTFGEEDRCRVIDTRVSNPNNPWFGTNGGTETVDKIFLLSIEEVVKYFGDSRQLRNKNRNTKYFISDNFNYVRQTVDEKGKSSCWWLRTPGNTPRLAANVTSDGRIVVSGDFVNRSNAFSGGVRPALWVSL